MEATAATSISEDETKERVLKQIKDELKRVRQYTPKVGVFGDTGVGKSSLCNALFGREIAKISDVEACTREPQEILVGHEGGGGIVLVDVPGIGEDPVRHSEYVALYKSLAPTLDLVLWAIKADDRKYASGLSAYHDIFAPNVDACPIVFVITQAEKIEPLREWDIVNRKPGEKQEHNLLLKIHDISSKFEAPTSRIVAISSNEGYNLVELVNKVVEVLPKEKKFSFVRETKAENVSDAAAENAEKGVWDHIKDVAGKAWDLVAKEASKVFVETVSEYAPKVISSVVSWFKSLW